MQSRILEAVGALSNEVAVIKNAVHGVEGQLVGLKRGGAQTGLEVVKIRQLVEQGVGGSFSAPCPDPGDSEGEDNLALKAENARLEQLARELRAKVAYMEAYHAPDRGPEPDTGYATPMEAEGLRDKQQESLAKEVAARQTAAGVRPELAGGRFVSHPGGRGDSRAETGYGDEPSTWRERGLGQQHNRGVSSRAQKQSREPLNVSDAEADEEDPGRFYRDGGYPWPQVASISDVWKEWSFGLNNLPSLVQLEEERKLFPGTNWRKGPGRKRFFERKQVADYILSFAKEKNLTSPALAADVLGKRYSSPRKLIDEVARLKK